MATEKDGVPLPTEPERAEGEVNAPGSQTASTISIWDRIKRHKVVEWTLAYVAFGYALLHGVQMLRETFEWPLLVPRLTVAALVLGAPIAVTLAWYHGHRARHRVSGQELSILIALLVVAGSVLWWVSRNTHERVPSVAAGSTATFNPPAHSIAVLPFVDMSEKHDQEYFADGMAEEILDILAKIPQLTVIGRTSSFQFKGHTEDLRAIGEKLRAAYIVEGSVRKTAARIRVTGQLIDARSGAHLWSDSYDRDFGDVLTLQDEIATSIARAMQVTIGARSARPLRDERAIEAYTLYLRGKVALDKFSTPSLLEAQTAFEQALKLDATLLPAAEGLALTYLYRGIDANDIAGRDAWDHTRSAAKNALQIDVNSATAHGILGYIAAVRDFDWSTAEKEFHAAFALNPNDPDTLANSGIISGMRGDYEEALRRINASLVLDPLNATTHQVLGLILFLTGDYSRAEVPIRKSLAIYPDINYSHWLLGLIQLSRGQREAALKEFEADPEVSNRDVGIALVNHALGRQTESDAALARVVKGSGGLWPYGVALVYAYRGERDQAFGWLGKAYTNRDQDLANAFGDPFLASLHDDPRWEALMKAMNLTSRRSSGN
jgi:TolB-like protein/Flp pilus assembly protein TadD